MTMMMIIVMMMVIIIEMMIIIIVIMMMMMMHRLNGYIRYGHTWSWERATVADYRGLISGRQLVARAFIPLDYELCSRSYCYEKGLPACN